MHITKMFLTLAVAIACAAAQADEEVDSAVEAIRQSAQSYVAAYNRGDAAALASHWSPTAVYVRRDTGERISGREAIAAMFQESFQPSSSRQLSVTIEAIRLITPDVAVEDGIAHIATEGGESLESTYTAVHVKRDGVWLLDSVRETDVPASSPSASNELAQLEWLVGEWLDQDEHATIRTRYEWAKNKSFLTSHFTVDMQGRLALEGTQIIAWDPVARQIRSWVFDSEGGFGEGVWQLVDDQWVVHTTSTLADGSQGSAVNVFAQVDEKTFTWKSVDRKLNGEQQPDIAEVSVYRQ